MSDQQKTNGTDDLSPRRAYVRPTVTVLGDVTELTMSGGGADMDLTSSQTT